MELVHERGSEAEFPRPLGKHRVLLGKHRLCTMGKPFWVNMIKMVPLGILVRACLSLPRPLLASFLLWTPSQLRSAVCKFELPYLGCDEPLCPVAIGQPATNDCSPSGNTAELKAWCQHQWAPWLDQLIYSTGVKLPPSWQTAIKAQISCEPETGFKLMKKIGAIEAAGWVLLWLPRTFGRKGPILLFVLMSFAVHHHITFLKDPPEALVLQFSMLAAALLVMLFDDRSPPPSIMGTPDTAAKAARAAKQERIDKGEKRF